MNPLLRLRNALCLGLVVFGLPAFAAADYLLELDGIPGESSDAAFPGAIEVEGWSFGANNNTGTGGTGGGGAGKAVFKEFTITKYTDKASPVLYLRCAEGTPIPKATLRVRKSRGDEEPVEYYTITLTDVLVTSVQTTGNGGGQVPTESFSLNFTKIEMEYKPARVSGAPAESVKTGWDLALNKKI